MMTIEVATFRPTGWVCPRCEATMETRELAPRCPTCGFREAAD